MTRPIAFSVRYVIFSLWINNTIIHDKQEGVVFSLEVDGPIIDEGP